MGIVMYTDNSFQHHDTLAFLGQGGSFKERLIATHEVVKMHFPFIARIAVALCDTETRVLKTYVHSSGDDKPLENYQSPLDNAPALKEILKRGQPRVINYMPPLERSAHEHTRRIGQQGYAASYTLPMFNNSDFFGFLFFNSYEAGAFTEDVLQVLDVYGHMIALMASIELSSVNTLNAAVRTAGHITHHRDPETGGHLDRMSRFSHLIARALADQHELDDDYIEHVFMFAPLHDIGKIAIPDHILLKAGALNDHEMGVMKTHVEKGVQMIDDLLKNFAIDNMSHTDLLRNIAVYHHEAVNGTGYPEGKVGEDIPLEARIVAVADVFDALTSKRPYKEAWSNKDAFEALHKLSGEQLDKQCVDALFAHREEVEVIQKRFKEEQDH